MQLIYTSTMFHRVGNIDANQGDTLMHPSTIQSAFLQDYRAPYQQKPGIRNGPRAGIADQGHRFSITNHPTIRSHMRRSLCSCTAISGLRMS